MRRLLVAFAALLLSCALHAQEAPEKLPPLLRDWVEWVKHGHEEAACPLLVHHDGEGEGAHVCAWPGELALQASARGAKFTVRWTVYARGAVPLPGDADHWPQQVRANALVVPVVPGADGAPMLWLEPGNYQVEGQFAWVHRPESLPVPAAIALVALSVDGASVFPVQREGNALWFGQAEEAPKEADSLELRVFRLLTDGAPATLETRIQLQVAGEGREEALGKPLPDGFAPTALGGDLPARLDTDGTLKVQVRPGSHFVRIAARAEAALAEVARPASEAPWPAQEIWSYMADARLRVTTPSGTHPIDPGQAGVPGEWAQLPAFLIEAGDKLAVEERSRGLSPQDQNRLTLSRELWLDFDGGAYRSKDRVAGRMVRDWRLDVAAPYLIVRADENGQGLLVTKGAKAGTTGIEVRNIAVNVDASTRIEAASKLPVAGWQQTFDSIRTDLHLPPGYRLYAAIGADQASGAWIERWNLLDVFLVAVTTLLAAWLGGRAFGALALGYLLLAYHESDAPIVVVLVVVALALVVKLMPAAGAFGAVLRWARNLAALVLVLIALPFAAEQVRFALYPQLERWSVDRYAPLNQMGFDSAVQLEMPMAPPPPAAPMMDVENAPVPQEEAKAVGDEMRQGGVGGKLSRAPAAKAPIGVAANAKQRYATNTLIQAGAGEPAWYWSDHQLTWAGPVLPTQEVRLVISPPWLTRLTRIALVALLAWLVVRFGEVILGRRVTGRAIGGGGAAVALMAISLAAGFVPSDAHAQAAPSDELLAELGKRVLEAPRCAPNCASLASVDISAEGDNVRVALEMHAAERVGVPLPGAEGQLAMHDLRVDGVAESGVRRDESGRSWIVVARGVHRIEMTFRAAASEKIGLAFPMRPARVVFAGKEWEAEGLRDERLLTDTLELVRVRKAAAGAGAAGAPAGGVQQFKPFVRVERTIDLGIDWSISTNVTRLAPEQAAFSVALPLLKGERVQSADLKVDDGRIVVPVQAGAGGAAWASQLDRADKIELEAPSLERHAEVWRIVVGPMWNVVASGVPAVYPDGAAQWVYEYHPLPGEKLVVAVSRPEAAAGATLAIDAATLATSVGKRATEHTLDLTVRSTQGGQHVIGLPEDAEVLEVSVGGQTINIRPEKGKLGVPIKPGAQAVHVRWRDNSEIGVVTRTPEVSLHAASSNLRLNVELPADRWVLRTSGPRVGPAVLYWGELLVMIVIAYGLSRVGWTPLKFRDWLLLGLGFSTASWLALVLVVAWLLALDWRARTPDLAGNGWFNLRQLALAFFTFIAVIALLGSVQKGLLGNPEMHLTGNGSTPSSLHWFHDRTDDALPRAAVVSIPLFYYKAAMFAWALWLATALVRWLRWGFASYAAGGYWRSRPKKPKPESAAATPPAPVEAPPAETPAPSDSEKPVE